MIRRDLASCADIDISPLRLGNKDVLAITVAQPHPHGMSLCYPPGDGELSPHNNSAHAKAPHASGTTRPPNGQETNMPWTNESPPEKSLVGLRLEIEAIEKALAICRG